MLSALLNFLPAEEIFATLIPVSLGLGIGIGFFGSFMTVRKHLRLQLGIIDEKSVFTHYEFDQRRQKKLREGKIDITYIHYLPNLSANSIGNYLRQKISWYKEKIKQGKYTFTKKGDYYEFLAKV